MKHLLWFLVLSILTAVANAGTTDPSVKDEKYIDYAKGFSYVGRLCGVENTGMKYCASAVAITPKHIITAAHVVYNSKTCTISINDKQIEVSKILIPKEFAADKFGEYDIALGVCDKDIGLDFYPELYDKDDEIGKVCSMSGFGLHGTFLTGAKKSDMLKRAGSNIIDTIDKHLLMCSVDDRKNRKTSLEFLIASGDSGGGLFIGNKLAGINSCVITTDKYPDSNHNDESGHTRISIHRKWILDNIENDKSKE